MDKKSLSERDICTKFITPALKDAGWNIKTQIREEVSFTDGKIIIRGKFVQRGKRKRAWKNRRRIPRISPQIIAGYAAWLNKNI